MQKNNCKLGKKCKFLHEKIDANAVKKEGSAGVGVQKREQKNCIFFPKGTCKNGANCQFRHLHAQNSHANGNGLIWTGPDGSVWQSVSPAAVGSNSSAVVGSSSVSPVAVGSSLA